ncbi:hypothetical protein O181_052807 [Austropuccinia psidii MF-1]|uniref:Uncharacterized protein n=1 Tax=Austropuccinia psidii MF-1 TaxID=1389203 RepID=A0A9Q3E8G5_9BASI|nr:hypothetical protein [Austropuccinia psidii MF-1]
MIVSRAARPAIDSAVSASQSSITKSAPTPPSIQSWFLLPDPDLDHPHRLRHRRSSKLRHYRSKEISFKNNFILSALSTILTIFS